MPSLRYIGDAHPAHFVRRYTAYIDIFKSDPAAVRLQHTHDRLKGGCLADAVSAKEAGRLSAFQLEIDVEENLTGAVVRGKIAWLPGSCCFVTQIYVAYQVVIFYLVRRSRPTRAARDA